MPSVPTQSAGRIFLARLAYLRARGGQRLVENVLARLPSADQQALRGLILPSVWFSLALNDRLDMAIAEELAVGGDRRQVFIEMGKASAAMSFQSAYRPPPGDSGPHRVLELLPESHKQHCSHGHMTYERTGEKSGVGRIYNAGYQTPFTCLTNVGWLLKAIELSGGRSPRVTDLRCLARGHPHCEYVCEWF
jgi:hypothetical protein